MFNDFDSEVVELKPVPDAERSMEDKGSQTIGLKTTNQTIQTCNTRSVGVQTNYTDELNPFGEYYDAEKLSKFLKKILPHLEEELKSSRRSRSELGFNQSDSDVGNISIPTEEHQTGMQKLVNPDFCKEKPISGLSWNSSEALLAFATSEKTHTSWCCHETSIGIYNTKKHQFEKEQPSDLLKVSGCVRCIKFHNRIPTLLAGGLHSGEVIVWDLKQDETTLVNKKGSGDETAHVDAITFLGWKENENGLWLVSAGRDGRIILWKVTTSNLTYEVHERFLLLKQHLTSTAEPNEHLEVVHMDFKSSEFPQFIAAGGGGTLFHCSMTTARPLASFPRYKDPVIRNYKPRRGMVTGVSCHPDVFASCGTDSEIHVFKYDQESPIMKFYTSYNVLLGVEWICTEELLSWGDSSVTHHRMQEPNEEKLICSVEGGVASIAFKLTRKRKTRNIKLAIGSQNGAALILSDYMAI